MTWQEGIAGEYHEEALNMDPKKEREYDDEIPGEDEDGDEAYEPTYRDGSARNECWSGDE